MHCAIEAHVPRHYIDVHDIGLQFSFCGQMDQFTLEVDTLTRSMSRFGFCFVANRQDEPIIIFLFKPKRVGIRRYNF